MMNCKLSVLFALLPCLASATVVDFGDITINQSYFINAWSLDNTSQFTTSGEMEMETTVYYDDGTYVWFVSPNTSPDPIWLFKTEDGYFGIKLALVSLVYANEGCTIPLQQAVQAQGGYGNFACYVRTVVAQVYMPPQGFGWPSSPQELIPSNIHPQHGRGETHFVGNITFIDYVPQGPIGDEEIFPPDREYRGSGTYTHPGAPGDKPKRVTTTNPDGTKDETIVQPGQTWTGTFTGTIAGGSGGEVPSVVVEDQGPDVYDPSTKTWGPTWTNPQPVPVDIEENDLPPAPEGVSRETESTATITVTQGAPSSGEPPPPPSGTKPPEGETSPNPAQPPPNDPENPEPPNENPNPNLDAINKTLKAGNVSLSNMDADLDEIVRIMRKEEAFTDQLQKTVDLSFFERLKQLISRTVTYTFDLFDDPAGFITNGFNAMKDSLTSMWSGFPGYSEVAGWAGVMSSARGYEAPTGVIPTSLSFTIMGQTFTVPLPTNAVIKLLGIIKIVVSALAIAFYFRKVYEAFMAGLGIAYTTPGSTGATTVEAKPTVAGFSIGSLKAPVIMLILGMVVIMAVNASLFAIASLRAESDQNFLSFLGNLQGSFGDFIAAASSASIDVGSTSINIGGGLLELIGAAVPLGLLFSFVILGPLYVFITIYLPLVVVGSALLWYARSIT